MLKSEKHKCKIATAPQKNRRLILEIGITFEDLGESSLKSSEISHYLNKKYDSQKHTHFEIRWHLDKNPKLFAIDHTKQYKNQYSEKYYIQLQNCSEAQRSRE